MIGLMAYMMKHFTAFCIDRFYMTNTHNKPPSAKTSLTTTD